MRCASNWGDPMRLDVSVYTNRGGREINEDSVRWGVRDGSGFFTVADGLGGCGSGEVSSDLAAHALLKAWEDNSVKPQERAAWLEEAIRAADRLLVGEQKRRGSGMKTTVAALSIDGAHAAWAHVGDTRVYRLTDGRIERLTCDHSVSYKKYQSGEISRNGVNFDEDRPSLLRVLGDPKGCRPESGSLEAILPGDAFLLCSGGFWEYLYDEELLIDFLQSDTPGQWAERMLVRALPRFRPGHDNLTLLAVFTG